MDHAIKTLSLLGAIAFVYSATFLYGELSGAHQTSVLGFLTFSDFVNNAPPTMVSFGLTFMIFILDQSPPPFDAPAWWGLPRWLQNLVFFALLMGMWALAVHYGYDRAVLVIVGTFAATGLLSEILKSDFENALGPRGGRIASKAVRILWLPLAIGYVFGWLMTVGSARETICTAHGVERGTGKLALDRGLVLFDHDSFQILPWSTVIKVDGTTPKPEKAGAAVVTTCRKSNLSPD